MKFQDRRAAFAKSIEKLRQILEQPKNEINRDSAIKRFELCFELCWKTIRDFLRDKGILVNSPKDSLKEAFKYGLVEDDTRWLEMLEDRNLCVHTYDEALAEKIYSRLKDYLKSMSIFQLNFQLS